MGKNWIGFTTDRASVVLGCNNSVLTRTKETFPNLWHQWSICHCLNLVASKASNVIPEHIDNFITKSISSKKLAEFDELQMQMKDTVKNLLNMQRLDGLVTNKLMREYCNYGSH